MGSRQKRKQRRRLKQQDENDPLIGYLAHSGINIICDGDGCIIAGSKSRMVEIIRRMQRLDSTTAYEIQPVRFSAILDGYLRGGAYCFDETAYGRFLKPGRQAGMALAEEDFSDPGPTGLHFVRIVRQDLPQAW